MTYAKVGPSGDQSAPPFADTANATEPTPFNAPAANEGGATQEACVLFEKEDGTGGASPKRHRSGDEKNRPVTETRVRPGVGPLAGWTEVMEGAVT